MADREKVIHALEVCSTVEDLAPCPNECPYHKPDAVCYGTARLMQDALALLREQEPVEPFHECSDRLYPRTLVSNKYFVFCPYCGRRIKWNA